VANLTPKLISSPELGPVLLRRPFFQARIDLRQSPLRSRFYDCNRHEELACYGGSKH
jgi:hypothetical protein